MDDLIKRADAIEAVASITMSISPNDDIESQNDVIEVVQTEHNREWIIGCIKHDGFIKTDRFDKANQIILDALQFAEHFDLLKEHESLQEVVLCKDCIYYETCNLRSSHWWKGGYTVDIEFCSFAERREPDKCE